MRLEKGYFHKTKELILECPEQPLIRDYAESTRYYPKADPSMAVVAGPSLTPSRGEDRRWSVTKESGLSASTAVSFGSKPEIREERWRTMGPL